MLYKEVREGHKLVIEAISLDEFKEFFKEVYHGVVKLVISQPTSEGIGLHLSYEALECSAIFTGDTIFIENAGKAFLGINESCNVIIREPHGFGEYITCDHVNVIFLPANYKGGVYNNEIKEN